MAEIYCQACGMWLWEGATDSHNCVVRSGSNAAAMAEEITGLPKQAACFQNRNREEEALNQTLTERLRLAEKVVGAMQDIRHLSLNYQKGLGIRMQEIGKIAHQTLSALDATKGGE